MEVGTKKTPNKGHFMDADSVQKTLEIFSLTTKNAILMNLTTITYLCEMFNLARNSDVTLRE